MRPFRGTGLAGGANMQRRQFIALVGGAVAMPLVARAQQDEPPRRIGVLQPFTKDSPESARIAAFLQELQRLGWIDGRNLQVEYRWETSDLRKAARNWRHCLQRLSSSAPLRL